MSIIVAIQDVASFDEGSSLRLAFLLGSKVALITDILNKDYTKQNPKRVPISPTITSAVSGVRPGMKN